VLFLCTGNSCRSHLAEGLLESIAGDAYSSLSAGTRPAGYVHPLAVRVMGELGIDISGHSSKSIESFLPPVGDPPDLVVSVCAGAEKECPPFPADVRRIHWLFEDPAKVSGGSDEQLAVFRRIRDEIRHRLVRALEGGEL